jgi:hypothetical protein
MVKLFVEGGGDSAALKTACREGFAKFLEKAGLGGRMPRIVACGGRQDAFDSFCTALNNGEAALLLVDSEALIGAAAQPGDGNAKEARSQWLPWQHLHQRVGDGWERPATAQDMQCHLMVQCMESWLVADRVNLKAFFGQGFQEDQLPAAARSLEAIPKEELYRTLTNATRNCKTKAQYGKGEHSFKLLTRVDPEKIMAASPWARRFVEGIQDTMHA